jgi:hypothetical protein
MRCASSAAVVDELLRRSDKVDEVNAPASTRRAVYFLRAVAARKSPMKHVGDKITLIPLHHKAFAAKHMRQASMWRQQGPTKIFAEM